MRSTFTQKFYHEVNTTLWHLPSCKLYIYFSSFNVTFLNLLAWTIMSTCKLHVPKKMGSFSLYIPIYVYIYKHTIYINLYIGTYKFVYKYRCILIYTIFCIAFDNFLNSHWLFIFKYEFSFLIILQNNLFLIKLRNYSVTTHILKIMENYPLIFYIILSPYLISGI